jgi:hypothetical protein
MRKLKTEGAAEEIAAAAEVAKEKHGLTEDEIITFLSPKDKEEIKYDRWENEEGLPPDH